MRLSIDRMNSSNTRVQFKQRSNASNPRFSRICSPHLIDALIVILSLVLFCSAIRLGCFYLVPKLIHAFYSQNDRFSKLDGSGTVCDVFDGKWVVNDEYPLYNASECPFIEQGFNCLGNGRTDDEYLRWQWKPNNCDIPRLDMSHVLEALRNKRVVFVGDSMSRTQWESMICLLMTGLEDKESAYEVNGNTITKDIRFLGVTFSYFNFTIEYYRSVFLVQVNDAPEHVPEKVKSTVELHKLDDISHEWIDSDVLIFNSGQWWIPRKLFRLGFYFQVGESLQLEMSMEDAFQTALQTWASWVDTMINPTKTRVFFRTFEPSHWRCNVTKPPPLDVIKGKELSPFSDAIFDVVKNMTFPVNVLHVTPMSAYRSDAHVGTWSDNPSLSDCSHWCLPGIPDVWNEIVISFLLGTFKTDSDDGSHHQ